MIVLNILFVLLFLFSVGCAVNGFMDKRRNIGFIIVALMVALGDAFSFALLGARMVKNASNIFLPYYILHAWSLFAFLIMLILIDRNRRYVVSVVLSAVICIYQTYLVISHYFGARIFAFQKRIYFRKAFWVAVDDNKNTGLFFSYRSYRIGFYINIFIILCVLIVCILHSNKIFRSRYYAFILIAIAYSVVEYIKIHFTIPVWIPCIAYNLISILALYLTSIYARSRLREWSLDSFANDMSDGLILYDKYDDLIHLNDMVKDTLNEGLLEDFKDVTKLQAWIEDNTDEDENSKIVTYEGSDRQYYFKVAVMELGGDDSHIGTLYILHDTTDSIMRIRAVEKANEELERASRMKSDFLANMSHEIRTPMNAVIGMAEIAMREKDPEQITDYLLQIQSSGKNLLNIINDILDYSKIESGKMEIIEEEYEPFEEYADIANVVATRIGDKPLELFVIVESDLPHTLCGDAMRIRQVLINLVNNAIKFTKQGMVRVHIRCENVSEDTVNISFHVIDTGIGIKEDDVKKLFVSFQQVDSKRNRSVEGTGLGLAISKRLVEAMGGTIGVDSEYGKGSDFWFEIPQRIVDGTNDILVENASEKHAYVLDENGEMLKMFDNDMKHLGVESTTIKSLDEYVPSGKKDYLFFKEESYDDSVKEFLGGHEDVVGIIFIGVSSEFTSDIKNLQVMRRPGTTMNMVHMLNDRYSETRKLDESKVFRADFTAPEAKILVVDDNQINLTIATDLLAPLKADLETADGGQEAIDKVTANEYDIVFMDHMMPEIDGVDATRTIRAKGDEIHQPTIIALSANVMEEAKRQFTEAGMSDFVAKPVDVRQLLIAVKKWLPPEKIKENDGTELDSEDDGQQEDAVMVNIEGLDIDTAVHALGSASLYNKIAGEYYRSGDDRLNAITEAFDKEDWTDYTIKVHALKSSSRQIGAMELGDMAEALEKAGKADDIDTIKADTDKTMTVFKELLDKLSEFFGDTGEDAADKPLIDRDTLDSLLDELEADCDNLDLDGMESVDAKLMDYSYNEEMHDDIEALHKAIADIDTDVCMEIIQRLR